MVILSKMKFKGGFMELRTTLEEAPKNPKRVAAGKQGGRPYQGGKEKTCMVQIKLTPTEHAILFGSAHNSGVTVTELFRRMLIAPKDELISSTENENMIPILIKNNPTYLTLEQAKDLYKQLTKVLIGE